MELATPYRKRHYASRASLRALSPGAFLFPLLAVLLVPSLATGDEEAHLRRTVEALSAPASRMTGYPGATAAREWLVAELEGLGIAEIYRHEFPVLVPIDEGFWLECAGERLELFGVWPNLVRTPTLPAEGIEGQLVYGGDGSRLEGQPVAGRIVLLDYVSGTAWVDAFHLGAAAVVFLESAGAHRKEAEQKFLDVPADLPRLYARKDVAERLRVLARSQAQVRLRGRMAWREVMAQNLVAVIPGQDATLKEEVVFLAAHYDAVSPVPALAPGAEQAASAAALLELARGFAEQPPKRTVALLWMAGHFQNMAGMRHFAPLLLTAAGQREGEVEDGVLLQRLSALETRFLVGLDLSSHSPRLGAFRPREPYRVSLLAPPITERLLKLVTAYEDSALGGKRVLVNGLKQDFARQGLGGMSLTVPLDAAVAALTGCPALAFCTVNDSRARFDAPDDYSGAVRFDWLGDQVALLQGVLPALIDDPDLEPWAWGNDAFGTIGGEVVHYGPRSYLPDQPTAGALVRVRLRHPTLAGVRPDFWAAADDSGRFAIPGVESGIIYTKPVRLEAYGLDAETGMVTDAPDWGINGERKLPGRALTVTMDSAEDEVQIVTAPLRGTTLFGIFDPRNLLTLERVQAIDAVLEAEPVVYGACLPLTAPEMELFSYVNRVGSWTEPVGVIFTQPSERFKAVMATGRYGLGRRLLLLNGTEDVPSGEGYAVDGKGRIVETVYRVAADMHTLNGERIDRLERHGVRNGRLAAFYERSAGLLTEAEAARAEHRHQDFFDRARRAWALAAAAYRDVERTQAGVVQGALFLLAVLIPFAHFAERLAFGFADLRRQVFGYFALFLVGFVALRYVHPAFELSISPAIILLGFVILALGILVTFLGMSRLNRELQELSNRRGQIAVQRSGAVLTSVAVGLAHLRRRPWRTGLTCATLVLLTFSVLSFTSVRAALHTNWIAIGADAAYEGALVRMPGWQTMELEGYDLLRDWFGDEQVAPRAWMSVSSLASSYRVERDDEMGRAVGVWGFVGLAAQEENLLGPEVVAGRWLRPGEEDACLLPVGLADSLGVRAEGLEQQQVRVFGEVFRVVGLLADDALDRFDLNGEPLTPLDPEAQQPSEAAVGREQGGKLRPFAHLPASATPVLPFAALMRWEGVRLASVGIGLDGGTEETRGAVVELAETLDLNLFAGLGGQRLLVNSVGVASVSGWGSLIVPLLIAGLIVFNTMLGAVYERTQEIGTFNAVGLAPGHVSGLFMAEAVALGVVGTVAGYLLGQGAAQLLAQGGFLPGLELNYSSLGAVLTVGSIALLVVASALYPARMAGRICTPGIERRWKLPIVRGEHLRVQLPFSLARREALGMAAFQAESWAANQEQSIGAGFYVEALEVEQVGEQVRVAARVWLAPFDQGVVQETAMEIEPGADPNYCDIHVDLALAAGDLATWQRVVRTFLDDVRKQFLIWRTLDAESRRYYAEQLPQWERG